MDENVKHRALLKAISGRQSEESELEKLKWF